MSECTKSVSLTTTLTTILIKKINHISVLAVIILIFTNWYYTFAIPIVGLTTGISGKTEDNKQSFTTIQVTTPTDISYSGKIRGHERPSVSSSATQHSDSNSNTFSNMWKKIRMINEKCPRCLMPHWIRAWVVHPAMLARHHWRQIIISNFRYQ